MNEINRTSGRVVHLHRAAFMSDDSAAPRSSLACCDCADRGAMFCDCDGGSAGLSELASTAPRIPRNNQPQPAEACTELGADDAPAPWVSYRPLVLLVAACGLTFAAALVALVRGLPF